MNLGATSVTSFGSYYAFGETTPKQIFSDTNYKGNINYTNIAGTENDAATKKYGKGWSVPTKEQFQELLDNCEMTNVIVNGIFVVKITGQNGNYIYLPYSQNMTMVKARDADATKQINEMLYKGGFANPSYPNLKFAAKQTGLLFREGIVIYYTAALVSIKFY